MTPSSATPCTPPPTMTCGAATPGATSRRPAPRLGPPQSGRAISGARTRSWDPPRCGCRNRFGIPFWLVGEFTTHFRTSGDWDFDPWPPRFGGVHTQGNFQLIWWSKGHTVNWSSNSRFQVGIRGQRGATGILRHVVAPDARGSVT